MDKPILTYSCIERNGRHIFITANRSPGSSPEREQQYKNNRRSIIVSYRPRKEELQHSL